MSFRTRLMLAAATSVVSAASASSLGQPAQPAADMASASFRVPAQVFAGEPRGPYETGTFEELWINEAQEDPSTAVPHDKRKVMVQVWYPATLPKSPRRAPYAISPQLYAPDHWARKLGHVRTQSVLDAPVALQPVRFPILVYNHGGSNPHFSGTFQTEFLASHGYVVVSIGHSGANGIRRFPDGTAYESDDTQSAAKPPTGERLSPRDEYEYRWAHSDLSLYINDVSFVLDRLAALDANRKHRFYRRLDLDRVGSLGWSLGGYISLQASREEPRIKAAANLDGWPYGLMGSTGVVTRGSERPVLLMFARTELESLPYPGGEVDAGQVELGLAISTYYWTMLRRSTADWYYVTIARTNHSHFSDRPLFEPANPQNLHPRAVHAIINAYTLEFFDKYVRDNRVDTPLLSGIKCFPEAMLLRPKKAQSDVPR